MKPATSIFYTDALAARVKRKFNTLAHSLYLDNAPDHTKSILISGVGRSGTTWLADVLNYANEYRLVYEPFNRELVPICKHFETCQYLRPHDDDPRYLEPARAIFTGRIRNAFVDQHNRRLISNRRLIKDVRSTLMLKWIREHFPGMPIVLIVRNPIATAISKVKLGWKGLNSQRAFLSQSALLADYLAPFVREIEGARTAFERHIITWCVETLVPLDQLEAGDVYLVFYENLRANPAAEFRKLFEFLEKPFDQSALSRMHRPSATSRKNGFSAVISGRSMTEEWLRVVSADELVAAKRVIAMFGLDRIYGDGSVPNAEDATRLFAKSKLARAGGTDDSQASLGQIPSVLPKD